MKMKHYVEFSPTLFIAVLMIHSDRFIEDPVVRLPAVTKKIKKETIQPLRVVELITDKKIYTPEEVLKKVTEFYMSCWNLQARYNQKIKKKILGKNEIETITSQGKIFLERPWKNPYRMIWDVESPVHYSVVTNLKTLWLYNPISQMVTIQRFQEMNSNTQFIINLLLGKANLQKNFTAQRSIENKNQYELKPIQPLHIKTLTVIVDPLHYWIDSLYIEDTKASSSEIDFSSIQFNRPEMKEMKVFSKKNQFIIPRGVIITN